MPTGSSPITRWERFGLVLLGIFVVAFAGLTELRSCFQSTRKTDFEVYARAAWAVRAGENIYQVTCSNHYHYTYPPAFAVLMAPFADAPAGIPRGGLIPFWLSVAIWTVLNFLLVGRMAHLLASIALPDEIRFSRRWWYARTIPFYVALGGIGYSIGFGQVNVVLVAMMVEMLRCSLTEKRFQSGLWLAAAMVLKVFPAYLILFPLIRREGRTLGGVACGLLVGLAMIPVAAFGVENTQIAYRNYVSSVLLPGAIGTESSVKELIELPSNDSQSFLAVIHSNLYPVRATQPATASKNTRLAHNVISALLTLATLVVIRLKTSVIDSMIALGMLSIAMLHICPMSHMHYYCFGYPLAAGLWLRGMSQTNDINPGWRVSLPLILWAAATVLPLFPGAIFAELRDRGLGLAGSMMLWTTGAIVLSRRTESVEMEEELPATIPFQRPAMRRAA